MAGTAFGLIVHALFGTAAGPPALYGMGAMGAVFVSAAQAPLTSLASVVEMTGDFALTLLAVGIATALSKKLTHGTIYTTKLLRRGTDIERVTPASVLDQLTVGDAMQPLPALAAGQLRLAGHHDAAAKSGTLSDTDLVNGPAAPSPWPTLAGPVLRSRQPQGLFTDEVLRQALRQLVLYGRDGLPVISADESRLCGWITNRNVLEAINTQLHATPAEAEQGEHAARFADSSGTDSPPNPLHGYSILEITITAHATAAGRQVGEIDWPPGSIVVATTHRGRTAAARDDARLIPGDRITVLVEEYSQRAEDNLAPAAQS